MCISYQNLTCDASNGAASNGAMGATLGATLDPLDINFQPWFLHPVTAERVLFTFDACHMIKLVRNSLDKFRILIDGDGNKIKWNYLEFLRDLQESQGLHLANKMRKKHIRFHFQMMKVYLATQLISNSVADALETCVELGFSQFFGCEPLVKFLRLFNNLFDVCNSKNLQQPLFKKPICSDNFVQYEQFLNESKTYIRQLELEDGTPIYCL